MGKINHIFIVYLFLIFIVPTDGLTLLMPRLHAEPIDNSTKLVPAARQLLDFIKTNKAAPDNYTGFSGTVLVARDDKILFEYAGGFASKRFNVPNKIDTKFNLGSINKMFTTTAIMRLVEAGDISLDDKLSKYLDATWLSHDTSSQIEIQHLMTHASGLGSYFTEEFFNGAKNHYRHLRDFKPFVVVDKAKFTPGTSYRYSNTGIFLLGAVIESVVGESYFDHLDNTLYKVAGMKNTGCFEMDQPIKNLAIGYNANSDKKTGWETNILWHPVKGGPAGGCYSTVHDLHKFALSFINNKFLTAKNTKLMITPKSEFHNEAYGFAFRVHGSDKTLRVGHSGGFIGIDANLDIYPNTGLIIVVLSNHGGGKTPVVDKARELFAGQ